MSKSLETYLSEHSKSSLDHSKHKTKVVATVGPACNTYEKLLDLVTVGVNVFRLNFSHGTHEDKLEIINHIRMLNEQLPVNIAILGDLQGPKLRVGDIENNGIMITPGDILTFTNEKCIGNLDKIYVSYPNLSEDVKIGNSILIDDGKIEVIVSEITPGKEVKVKVIIGGILSSKKGINLPQTKISLPALTEKDLVDLDFIIEQKLDWVALSFVRSVKDLVILRSKLEEKNSKIKIIAKIEKPEAVNKIDEIIEETDAIMIARGDLGVELPVEHVPLIQRTIIRKCIRKAKPVIVATQMMESMIDHVKPNRSEITDVANAVLEGADAVMLSGETATGQHPAMVVETMRKIINTVECTEYRYNLSEKLDDQDNTASPTFIRDAVCHNAMKMAKDIHANALIGRTKSSYTAFILSSFRPESPLFIFTNRPYLLNQLSLLWGVRSFFYDKEDSFDSMVEDHIKILKGKGLLKPGDVVVNTGSTPIQLHYPTNTIKVSKVE